MHASIFTTVRDARSFCAPSLVIVASIALMAMLPVRRSSKAIAADNTAGLGHCGLSPIFHGYIQSSRSLFYPESKGKTSLHNGLRRKADRPR